MSYPIKITKRQTSGKDTVRKCPECKEYVRCDTNGRFRIHKYCLTSGFSPSEWREEKKNPEVQQRVAYMEKVRNGLIEEDSQEEPVLDGIKTVFGEVPVGREFQFETGYKMKGVILKDISSVSNQRVVIFDTRDGVGPRRVRFSYDSPVTIF